MYLENKIKVHRQVSQVDRAIVCGLYRWQPIIFRRHILGKNIDYKENKFCQSR